MQFLAKHAKTTAILSVIGISGLIYYYFIRKPKCKYYTREEFMRQYCTGFDSNFNHHHTEAHESRTTASVAVGKSELTGTLSSRTSIRKGSETDVATSSIEGANYGKLGLKSLGLVIDNLESCIFKLNRYDEEHQHNLSEIPRSDSRKLFLELQNLLENAYMIRNKYKQKLICTDQSYVGSDDSLDSSDESFVSAMEYHVDDNIEDIIIASDKEKRFLYKSALVELENGSIYYRSKRTDLVKCANDTDFIAKMYCLRQASFIIVENDEMVNELETTGLKIGSLILKLMEYDDDNFQHAYKRLMKFLKQPCAKSIMQEELCDKGVEIISLYDVLFDYMLMDALEVLDSPPSSIVSVINNRWLSQGFKKTALASSVWTIMLARRKFLKYKSGFKAHICDLIDEVGAPLAWAFLGNEVRANQIAVSLKDELMSLIAYMFSDVPRFTTVEELAVDLVARICTARDNIIHELDILDLTSSSNSEVSQTVVAS